LKKIKKQEENNMQNAMDEIYKELKAKGAKEINVIDIGQSFVSRNGQVVGVELFFSNYNGFILCHVHQLEK
jgi:DUF1009 family protein